VDREIARALLEAPSAAVLAVYRADGTVLMSPVWFRADDDWVEIVIAERDAKLEQLRAEPDVRSWPSRQRRRSAACEWKLRLPSAPMEFGTRAWRSRADT